MKKGVTIVIVEVNIYAEIVLTGIIIAIVINVGHQVIWRVDVTRHYGETKCDYLITAYQISNPLLGFNAIKHIAQTADDKPLIRLFQTSSDWTDVNSIQAFVNLLQTPDSAEAAVKVKGKNTVVSAGCVVEVPWKANIGNLSQTQSMISQQEETELAEGLAHPIWKSFSFLR